ncbi:MAG: PEGA domain-containing protein [Methanoregula sp.]|nr:PEGA domain-containing protein [Methanoregula sp.]
MLKFCPKCGSSVQEKMRFCTNCGSAIDDDGTQEMKPVKPEPDTVKKVGRKIQYLLIAAVFMIFLVAGLGYLFSQSSLFVQSDPVGAGVYLNSEFRGITPCVIHYLLPGEYHLEFRHEGYPSWKKNITVTLGQAETINADLSDNLIPEVKVLCFSGEMIQNTTAPATCMYKKGEAVTLSGTAVRPHPKENPSVTITVYTQGTASPLKTQSVAIRSDNSYNLTLDGTTLPSGNYHLVASLPSGQNSTVAFIIESQEDTNIRILRQIVEDYHKIHTYSLYDYFVCADMAQDVWNIVETQGMQALLVAGNIQNPDAGWKDYNHVWVIVEAAPRQWVALETTGGFLVYKKENPNYYRGIFFENPKDLKTNMDLRRDSNNEIERSATIVSQYNAKVSEYNAELDYYRSVLDFYNNKYAGRGLTAAEYQESLGVKQTIDSKELKLVQLKAELDQLTITYNNEKQIMDRITAQMNDLAAKGAVLMNS